MNKIKLVIFDLDGVLCTSREWHYEALNTALESIDPKYVISREEHLSKFDGLPTSKKLKLLTELKGLPENLYNKIWKDKQKATIKIISSDVRPNTRLIEIFNHLAMENYKIAVCSNSIRETTRKILVQLGIMDYIDYYYSNEDVKHPKPSSEMYLRVMIDCNCNPRDTLILEDSHIGRTAVLNSGAHLLPIRTPDDVTLDLIINEINHIEGKTMKKPKWQGGKMNVLIPMAGAGKRFAQAGFTFPKPLIPVNVMGGKPMIQVVVENLNIDAHHIFLVQREHYEKFSLQYLLNLISPDCTVIQVDGVTEGAACTALLAKKYINNDQPLLIADSDHYLEWDSNEFMYSMQADTIDGGITTLTATHPKYSFCRLDENGYVVEVAEKKPISDIANSGQYYWSKGSDFVKYAEQMINKNIRTNNEFYIAPVYNEAIADGKKIKIYPIKRHWAMGDPESLEYFEENYGR